MRIYRILLFILPVLVISVAFKIAYALRKKERLTTPQFMIFMNISFVLALVIFVIAGICYYYPE